MSFVYRDDPESGARPLTDGEKTLLQTWHDNTIQYERAHKYASKVLERWGNVLETLLVILPALAAACEMSFHYSAVLFSLGASLALAVSQALQCSEEAEAHSQARNKFKSLRKKIESMFEYAEVRQPKTAIAILQKKYDEILAGSPIVPQDKAWEDAKNNFVSEKLKPSEKELQSDFCGPKKDFSDEQRKTLEEYLQFTRKNRMLANEEMVRGKQQAHRVSIVKALVAVLTTSCTFGAAVGSRSAGRIAFLANIMSTVLGGYACWGGYGKRYEMMKNTAVRWSALAREVYTLLHTEPHSQPDTCVEQFNCKLRAFEDELDNMKVEFISKRSMAPNKKVE